jgi:site-specific recombinase XerD
MTTIEKFELELRVRRYSANTIKTYSSCLQMIIAKIGEQPTENQIKQLLLDIKSVSYHKQISGTILKYYAFVLKQSIDLRSIPFPRKEYKLPEVFSQEEVKKLFSVINNKKHLPRYFCEGESGFRNQLYCSGIYFECA